jgi:hypothetical protein
MGGISANLARYTQLIECALWNKLYIMRGVDSCGLEARSEGKGKSRQGLPHWEIWKGREAPFWKLHTRSGMRWKMKSISFENAQAITQRKTPLLRLLAAA